MSALRGIRVLDFTHAIAGPTCTQMLFQLGAEVTKIEPPGTGDDFRHYTEHAGMPGLSIPFAAVNAGKRSVAIDLKHPQGRDVALRLARDADIVVENYRPGVIARLGLGYDAIRAVNSSVIMLSLSGFGQTGRLRDWGAYDHIAQAASGMAMMNATAAGPTKIGIPVVDSFSGYLGAIAILAALRERDRTGEGKAIDVAMLDAALKLMGSAASVWSFTGESPQGTGNRGFRLVATAEYYACADGWIALGANHQHQIVAMFEALGHPEMIEDPRFADHHARVANYTMLKGWLTEHLRGRRADELERILTGACVPAARIREVGDILQDPHLLERRLLSRARLPGRNEPLAIVGPGFGAEAESDVPEVPGLGAHTDEVLLAAGLTAAEIVALRRAGAIR